MSHQQTSRIPPEVQLDVDRLKGLYLWLQHRLERIEQLCSFDEVMPDILKAVLSLYKDAVRGLLQLTRAYMTGKVANGWQGFHADHVTDLEDFARLLCHYSIPQILNRSDITLSLIKPLIENVLCPHQLFKRRFDEYRIKNRIAKVTDEARRDAIDNSIGLYMFWLEEWCGGQYNIGHHFRYREPIVRTLRNDLDDIEEEVDYLAESVRNLRDHGFKITDPTWDNIDSEPPPDTRPMSSSDRLKLLSHRWACRRRVGAFTEQIINFCSSGWRFASLENT